jgi:hypothetical protein
MKRKKKLSKEAIIVRSLLQEIARLRGIIETKKIEEGQYDYARGM